MNRQELTEMVRAAAKNAGADLVGIASRGRFESLPADKSPLSIFPEMKSMIVIGRRILRGSMRGVEEGTSFSSTYGFFGFQRLEDNFLAQTTYDLTIAIEKHDYEAVPLFAYRDEGMPKADPVAPGKPAPNIYVDPRVAAQAAGLGEIGLGDFLITDEFGTRQRIAMILTDAELDADPIAEKSICEDCGACAEACPFGAIDLDTTRNIGVPRHEMAVAGVDLDICRSCPNGAMKGPGRGDYVDRIAAACGRACLTRLEGAGKVKNHFENKFRKREPWALDAFHRTVPVDGGGKPSDIGCGRNVDTIGNR